MYRHERTIKSFLPYRAGTTARIVSKKTASDVYTIYAVISYYGLNIQLLHPVRRESNPHHRKCLPELPLRADGAYCMLPQPLHPLGCFTGEVATYILQPVDWLVRFVREEGEQAHFCVGTAATCCKRPYYDISMAGWVVSFILPPVFPE